MMTDIEIGVEVERIRTKALQASKEEEALQASLLSEGAGIDAKYEGLSRILMENAQGELLRAQIQAKKAEIKNLNDIADRLTLYIGKS